MRQKMIHDLHLGMNISGTICIFRTKFVEKFFGHVSCLASLKSPWQVLILKSCFSALQRIISQWKSPFRIPTSTYPSIYRRDVTPTSRLRNMFVAENLIKSDKNNLSHPEKARLHMWKLKMPSIKSYFRCREKSRKFALLHMRNSKHMQSELEIYSCWNWKWKAL